MSWRPGMACVLVGQDDEGTPVYRPTCIEHERQWFGPQTYDLGTATYNATAHDSNHHQGEVRPVI